MFERYLKHLYTSPFIVYTWSNIILSIIIMCTFTFRGVITILCADIYNITPGTTSNTDRFSRSKIFYKYLRHSNFYKKKHGIRPLLWNYATLLLLPETALMKYVTVCLKGLWFFSFRFTNIMVWLQKVYTFNLSV